MNKIGTILLALVLTVAFAIPMATPVIAHTESAPQVQTLLAGQDIEVGNVSVWNNETTLYVTYEITESPWIITETHLYAGKNVSPTTAPGQFPYDAGDATSATNTTVTYEIPLDGIDGYSMQLNKKGKPTGVMVADGNPGVEPCDNISIAAHAVVQKYDGPFTDCLVSGAGSDNVLYLDEATSNPGYPEGYTAPYQSYAGTPNSSVLAWTHSSWAGVAGAEWISSSYYTENTDNNTWRLFTRSFDLPADAVNISGHLQMNCDNAEEVYLNSNFVGNGSPAIVYGASVKDTSPPPGDAHGWNSVESWDVSSELTAGTNELWTMTRNYAWSGGPMANPTGYAYKLCYQYDIVTEETAWADGTRFVDRGNWATYFSYGVQGWQELEEVEVMANGTIASSTNVLDSSGSYKLVANGTYKFANWGDAGIADAEYSLRPPGKTYSYHPELVNTWVNGADIPSPHTHYLQVWGGDPLAPLAWDWDGVGCNPDHEYTVFLTGDGDTMQFRILDNAYGDNSGSITVTIYEWN